jgi:DNA processing protein
MPEEAAEGLRRGLGPAAVLARLHQNRALPFVDPAAERVLLDRDVERLERLGVRVVPGFQDGYPESLRPLVDAPPVLLVRGDVAALGGLGIAIVGARAATRLGRQTARRLGRELAERGLTIVSGLARGIDAEAHRGALEADGTTVAVLACGPDRIYPPEHRRLADEILERGAILSEMPLGVPPRPAHFPLRNRLISGLSLAVVVVEARRRSGSLITVRHALDQGREVFVVPGSVDGPFAEGTNHLLREGARAIRHAADVIEDLGLELVLAPAAAEGGGEGGQSPEEPRWDAGASLAAALMALLGDGPLTRDELRARSAVEAGGLARALLELELSGRVVEERDGRIHLCRG